METEQAWALMPVMGAPELTEAAIGDLLAQTVPIKILIINQGVETSFRQRLEQISEEYPDRVFVWSHCPPLPSLSASWNRALRFVWSLGGTEALVVNNDLQMRPSTYERLRYELWDTEAMFVSAVGVTAEQYAASDGTVTSADHGGPDFSCFMVSIEGHTKYPFDERFVPAFCEDLDQHRRYMLGGDGARIYSINLPYLHVGGGSNTLKAMSPERRAAHEARIGQCRAYYRQKWGGDVNAERYILPFDATSARDDVATPALQRMSMNKLYELRTACT